MNKSQLLKGVTLMSAFFGVVSCSDKTSEPFVDEVVDISQTRYITVSLCNPSNFLTRDDDEVDAGYFDDGASSESDVNELVFVFYDGSGTPTAQPVSLRGNAVSQGWQPATNNPAVTSFWTSTLPVELTQGQNRPVYVMCFVNPIDNRNLTTMTIQEVEMAKRSVIVNGGYFAMSNSVFYGSNPITGQSNVRMMATPIVSEMLYETEDEAKDPTAQKIDIYVERYAAKIGLTMKPSAISSYDVMFANYDELVRGAITFIPAYWRPNAIDLQTYVTKAFATSYGESDPSKPATFDAMNHAFENTGMPGQGLTGWNDATNNRSYWACSPSYYANSYPHCSDNITDASTYPYDLKYFTFNEIAEGVEGEAVAWDMNSGFLPTTAADGTTKGYYYSRETTAAIESLTAEGINNKAVPASVVIVGNYRLEGQPGNSTFYLYGKADGLDVYYTDANIEQALISNQNVIFTNDEGTARAVSTDYFEVVHPSKAVRGDQNVAGRLVTIQINETNVPSGLFYYDGNAFVAVTKDNVVAANQLLWASASTAQKFYNGLAFFSIPIRHLGWDRNVDAGRPLLTDPESGRASMINWQNLRRGDLGVVRNHVYSVEVTGIVGLGVGIENADQPIVPPMDPANYYVATRLNILPWRVVPTSKVVL